MGEIETAVLEPSKRPKIVKGSTTKYRVACSNLYVTVNENDGKPIEVFTHLGKAGGCPSQSEAVGRLASLALRSGIELNDVIRQLRGIRCHACMRQQGNGAEMDALSCPDAVARALSDYENKEEVSPRKADTGRRASVVQMVKGHGPKCPECGEHTVLESGCIVCKHCGYSKCG